MRPSMFGIWLALNSMNLEIVLKSLGTPVPRSGIWSGIGHSAISENWSPSFILHPRSLFLDRFLFLRPINAVYSYSSRFSF